MSNTKMDFRQTIDLDQNLNLKAGFEIARKIYLQSTPRIARYVYNTI